MLIKIEAYSNADGQTTMYFDCYSYQTREFESIFRVLQKSRVEYSQSRIRHDKDRRIGIRYSLLGRNIEKLESYLKIKFFSTEVIGEGESFKCERVPAPLTNQIGCKTIYADDKDSADMICAIVAKKNSWFGGVTERGRCRL